MIGSSLHPAAVGDVVYSARTPHREYDGWVVSPSFDLLFIANVAWPLLLLQGLSGRSETVVDFWQVYFLTLPHRWITLILVVLDPDRRGRRGLLLAAIAAVAFLVVVGIWLGTSSFTCLAVVDYIWNAWHFASQHSGVLRIYSRKVGGGWAPLERHGLRFFVTYTILRTATWTTGWLDDSPSSDWCLRVVDGAALAVPALFIVPALARFTPHCLGRTMYLVSLCGLYTGQLLSLSYGWAPGVITMTTASSMFHAVEYMAIVTFYARRRRAIGSAGAFRRLAGVWLSFLAVYAVMLGAIGVWLDGKSSPIFQLWQGVNLWAAMVHYAFDGVIWKLRQPETARALGAETTVSAA
jgi:hypothetical protein